MGKTKTLNRVFISIVLVIYVITTLLGAVIFYQTSTNISDRYLRDFIKTQNELKVKTILAFMEKEIAMSRRLAEDDQIIKWMLDEGNVQLAEVAEKQLSGYREYISSGTNFIAVHSNRNYYLNDIFNPAKVLKDDYLPDRWFFEAIKKNQDYSLNVDYQESLGEIRLWINVIVRDKNGTGLGLAGSGIYINDFLNEIVSSQESNIHTILIDDKGNIQAHEDRDIVDHNGMAKKDEDKITLYDMIDNQQERQLIEKTVTEIKDSSDIKIININYQKKKCLATVAFIPELNWYNIVLIEKNSIMGWQDFLPLILLFMISAFVIIISIIFIFTRLISNPLKKLADASDIVSKGNYDIDIPIERENEIGQLSRSFNRMTQEIKRYIGNLESLVAERTKELNLANTSLVQAKKRIVDSIEYAKLIQNSILFPESELKNDLNQFFIIYEPLDIVGGDFYFFKKTDKYLWLASIDCTGHGVPGAFMTMMANVILHGIIESNPLGLPSEILREFHFRLRNSLNSKSNYEHLDNGLDIALCRISKEESQICFAGASLPLIYYDGEQILQIKGDSLHIGYDINGSYNFTDHFIQIRPNSFYYLITDGVLDIPGGKKGFGLGRGNFLKILQSVKDLHAHQQKTEIERQLKAYMGGFENKDDMMIFGFGID